MTVIWAFVAFLSAWMSLDILLWPLINKIFLPTVTANSLLMIDFTLWYEYIVKWAVSTYNNIAITWSQQVIQVTIDAKQGEDAEEDGVVKGMVGDEHPFWEVDGGLVWELGGERGRWQGHGPRQLQQQQSVQWNPSNSSRPWRKSWQDNDWGSYNDSTKPQKINHGLNHQNFLQLEPVSFQYALNIRLLSIVKWLYTASQCVPQSM